ncbi:hypothetical protein FVEN_g10644 [Fusarium venenatum]|nr:hypothetical protein FVEN_g10644 [Fusarium venenatum]
MLFSNYMKIGKPVSRAHRSVKKQTIESPLERLPHDFYCYGRYSCDEFGPELSTSTPASPQRQRVTELIVRQVFCKLASCSRSTVSPTRRQTQRAATLLDSAVTYLLFKPDYHVARLATALPHQPQINVLSNAKKVKDQSTSSKWRRGQNSAELSAFVESHSHLRVYTPTTFITTPIHTFTVLPRPGPDLI